MTTRHSGIEVRNLVVTVMLSFPGPAASSSATFARCRFAALTTSSLRLSSATISRSRSRSKPLRSKPRLRIWSSTSSSRIRSGKRTSEVTVRAPGKYVREE